MKYSPIVLFVYNRVNHTRLLIESLLKNSEAEFSELFIFSDFQKRSEDRERVSEVRRFLKTVQGFKAINIIERDVNFGLSKSVITGVSEIVNKFGSVIVLEDDLIVSPGFLTYMNEALDKYKNTEDIISIHGYTYPVKVELPQNFFLKGADCWGWATWKRGWDLFNADGKALLKEIEAKNLGYEFDFDGQYPYVRMLKEQVEGKNNSWAIRWYASAFLNNKLTLYPGKSLVQNVGFDDSGENCEVTDNFSLQVSDSIHLLDNIPIRQSEVGRKAFVLFFKSIKVSLFERVIKKMKKIIGTGK